MFDGSIRRVDRLRMLGNDGDEGDVQIASREGNRTNTRKVAGMFSPRSQSNYIVDKSPENPWFRILLLLTLAIYLQFPSDLSTPWSPLAYQPGELFP